MATSFTVMTWNVENLFPPGYPVSPDKQVTLADYDAKLNYLAQTIDTIKPDVLALQEVGGRDATDTTTFIDLNDRVPVPYPFTALSNHPDPRGIRVGFFSRFTIVQRDDLVDFAPGELALVPDWAPRPPITAMARSALRIEIELAPGIHIRLITLHLKSKLISYPAVGGKPRFAPKSEDERTRGEGLALLRRAAEATAVRVYLNGLMQPGDATHTIVLGDMNDEPRAATSQMVGGPQDQDVTSDDKLDYIRLYNLVDSIPRRGGESQDKWFVSESERFSRLYKGRRELIDHIYVSKSLLGPTADLRQNRWHVQEVRSVVDSIQGQSIGDNPVERVGKEHPDHAPVYARFEL